MLTTFSRLACTLALTLAGAAQASVITFDPFDEQGTALALGDTITAQTYVFTLRNDAPALLFAADLTGAYASNGSATLYAANNAMFSVTGGPSGVFSISGFELGGGNLAFLDPFGAGSVEPWATDLTLLATFADNSQMSTSFAIDQAATGLGAVVLNLTNLIDLKFSANGDFSLDNLQLNAVSEPASLALMAVALAGLAMATRRRRPAVG